MLADIWCKAATYPEKKRKRNEKKRKEKKKTTPFGVNLMRSPV